MIDGKNDVISLSSLYVLRVHHLIVPAQETVQIRLCLKMIRISHRDKVPKCLNSLNCG